MPSEYADLDAYTAETAQPPATGQRFIRDNRLPGFALRVTSTGAKSWIVEAAVRGQKHAKRRTLGRYPGLQADRARKLAIKELGRFAEGKDALTERRTERAVSLTLGDVFETYLEARDLKPGTLASYRTVFDVAFPDWRQKQMTAITRTMIENRHKRETERSPAQANLAMRLLRALFNYAIGRYEDPQGNPVVVSNPVSRLSATRSWNRIERRKNVIRPHQLPAWYDALEAVRAESAGTRPVSRVATDWIEFLLLTGCRRKESLNLRWTDVDLEGKLFRLPDTKNREIHELPLTDRLVEILERRKKENREIIQRSRSRLAPAAPPPELENPFIFPGVLPGSPLAEGRAARLEIIRKSGVPFAYHDLRRTFATTAENLGLPTYTIKRLMNHTVRSGDVTGGYIQIDVERLRVPLQQITDAILKAAGRAPDAAPTVVAFPVTKDTAAR